MKCFSAFSLCVLLSLAGTARGSILTWNCASGDGAISCPDPGWWDDTADGNYVASISGSQFSSPGSMISSFSTNTTGDPTIKYINDITNTDAAPWTGYNIEVKIDTPLGSPLTPGYAITAASVDPTTTSPGWTATITQNLLQDPSVLTQNEYVGYISMGGGPPIANDSAGELDFRYTVSFQGSTQYTETQVLMPQLEAVPEPGTLALLAGGLILLFGLPIRRHT
jgi:hypothetical protein